MNSAKVDIDPSWEKALKKEFNSDYFQNLKKFLIEEKVKFNVFPPGKLIFNAFNHTPFNEVKVVIIGQDPYHAIGQAHGLSFSVPPGIRKPSSLINIFKELKNDLNLPVPPHGNLEKWADQGVLLLNASLTVRENEAGSHQKKGWEQFTDAVIKTISDQKEGAVFLLWGRFAQAKEVLIDKQKHFILKAAHPSGLSASRGFFGCRHFSKTNQILKEQGLKEIDWKIE